MNLPLFITASIGIKISMKWKLYSSIRNFTGESAFNLDEKFWFMELYCSIRNCTGERILVFSGLSSCKSSLKSSNLIGNNINKNGLIYAETTVTVEECTILENNANPIFYSSRSITVINCTITKEDILKTNNNNVNIDQWTPNGHSFINGIKPTFVNELCSVGYDIVGTLTPNLPKSHFGIINTCDETFLIFTHKLIHMFLYHSILFCLPSQSNQ